MKTIFAILAACSLTMSAHAGCYSVYNPAGHLVYQSSEAPVDTRVDYHQTVPQRFGRGSTLVYVNDDLYCPAVATLVGVPGSSPGQARPRRTDRG